MFESNLFFYCLENGTSADIGPYMFFMLLDAIFSLDTFLCGLQPLVRKKCIKRRERFYVSFDDNK